MTNRLILGLSISLCLISGAGWAEQKGAMHEERHEAMEKERMEEMEMHKEGREHVYGWELMSKQERLEYRRMMRSLHTEQERQAYRKQHHEKMKKRAEEAGLKLQERAD